MRVVLTYLPPASDIFAECGTLRLYPLDTPDIMAVQGSCTAAIQASEDFAHGTAMSLQHKLSINAHLYHAFMAGSRTVNGNSGSVGVLRPQYDKFSRGQGDPIQRPPIERKIFFGL